MRGESVRQPRFQALPGSMISTVYASVAKIGVALVASGGLGMMAALIGSGHPAVDVALLGPVMGWLGAFLAAGFFVGWYAALLLDYDRLLRAEQHPEVLPVLAHRQQITIFPDTRFGVLNLATAVTFGLVGTLMIFVGVEMKLLGGIAAGVATVAVALLAVVALFRLGKTYRNWALRALQVEANWGPIGGKVVLAANDSGPVVRLRGWAATGLLVGWLGAMVCAAISESFDAPLSDDRRLTMALHVGYWFFASWFVAGLLCWALARLVGARRSSGLDSVAAATAFLAGDPLQRWGQYLVGFGAVAIACTAGLGEHRWAVIGVALLISGCALIVVGVAREPRYLQAILDAHPGVDFGLPLQQHLDAEREADVQRGKVPALRQVWMNQ